MADVNAKSDLIRMKLGRWLRFITTNSEIRKDQFQNGGPKYKKWFVLDETWYLRVCADADYDL